MSLSKLLWRPSLQIFFLTLVFSSLVGLSFYSSDIKELSIETIYKELENPDLVLSYHTKSSAGWVTNGTWFWMNNSSPISEEFLNKAFDIQRYYPLFSKVRSYLTFEVETHPYVNTTASFPSVDNPRFLNLIVVQDTFFNDLASFYLGGSTDDKNVTSIYVSDAKDHLPLHENKSIRLNFEDYTLAVDLEKSISFPSVTSNSFLSFIPFSIKNTEERNALFLSYSKFINLIEMVKNLRVQNIQVELHCWYEFTSDFTVIDLYDLVKEDRRSVLVGRPLHDIYYLLTSNNELFDQTIAYLALQNWEPSIYAPLYSKTKLISSTSQLLTVFSAIISILSVISILLIFKMLFIHLGSNSSLKTIDLYNKTIGISSYRTTLHKFKYLALGSISGGLVGFLVFNVVWILFGGREGLKFQYLMAALGASVIPILIREFWEGSVIAKRFSQSDLHLFRTQFRTYLLRFTLVLSCLYTVFFLLTILPSFIGLSSSTPWVLTLFSDPWTAGLFKFVILLVLPLILFFLVVSQFGALVNSLLFLLKRLSLGKEFKIHLYFFVQAISRHKRFIAKISPIPLILVSLVVFNQVVLATETSRLFYEEKIEVGADIRIDQFFTESSPAKQAVENTKEIIGQEDLLTTPFMHFSSFVIFSNITENGQSVTLSEESVDVLALDLSVLAKSGFPLNFDTTNGNGTRENPFCIYLSHFLEKKGFMKGSLFQFRPFIDTYLSYKPGAWFNVLGTYSTAPILTHDENRISVIMDINDLFQTLEDGRIVMNNHYKSGVLVWFENEIKNTDLTEIQNSLEQSDLSYKISPLLTGDLSKLGAQIIRVMTLFTSISSAFLLLALVFIMWVNNKQIRHSLQVILRPLNIRSGSTKISKILLSFFFTTYYGITFLGGIILGFLFSVAFFNYAENFISYDAYYWMFDVHLPITFWSYLVLFIVACGIVLLLEWLWTPAEISIVPTDEIVALEE